LKTDDEWTSTAHGLIEKLIALIKQKDIHKFESALRDKYSTRLVPKYFFLPFEDLPIIDILDELTESIYTKKDVMADTLDKH
jgi:hypothetical protein